MPIVFSNRRCKSVARLQLSLRALLLFIVTLPTFGQDSEPLSSLKNEPSETNSPVSSSLGKEPQPTKEPQPKQDSQHVWLVGGGSQIQNAQAQIADNIRWQRQVFQQRVKPRSLQILFGAGKSPLPDIKRFRRSENFNAGMAPLALVFGDGWANGFRFDHHKIDDVLGSTQVDNLKSRLTNHLIQLKPGDAVFLGFNGYGSKAPKDLRQNAMLLWDNTALSVREMDEILNVLPPEIPVRMVMSQCYSAAFANLIYRQSEQKEGMSTYRRCGFFAQSAQRPTGGCFSELNPGADDSPQDYIRYFYSAIAGRHSNGEATTGVADTNANGRVSLREAHFYALENAYSLELSRSTSEVFLENWQPWYTKWHTNSSLPDNEYGRLAQRLAKRYDVTDSSSLLVQREAAQHSLEALNNRLLEQSAAVRNLQSVLQQRLIKQWPALAAPYTDNYRELMVQQVPSINRFLQNQPEFEVLVTQFQDKANIMTRIQEFQRQLTQYEKIRRMRKLARLLANFEMLGNEVRQREYNRLIECEEAELQSSVNGGAE